MKQSTRIALLTIGALALAGAVALSTVFALATKSEALRPLANLGMIVALVPEATR
jgi:hypothetical protein